MRNNIITSAMDVILLFLLLPKYGMQGYYFSFFVTHLLNFCLSIRLLFRIVGAVIHIKTPLLCLLAAVAAVSIARLIPPGFVECAAFTLIFSLLLLLLGIVRKNDILWLKGLIRM